MTDNDIIKALEHCLYKDHGQSKCTKCEYVTGCKTWLMRNALDLINRQRAEINELQHKYDLAVAEREANVKGFTESIKTAKAEAVKEFAEQIAERFKHREQENKCSWCKHSTVWGNRSRECDMDNGNGRVRCFFFDRWESCVDDIVNNLVKEMVGEQRKGDEKNA